MSQTQTNSSQNSPSPIDRNNSFAGQWQNLKADFQNGNLAIHEDEREEVNFEVAFRDIAFKD